jgi:hypothetical protein
MRYRKLPVEIDATQWFKNGDHPNDGVGQEARDPFNDGTYIRIEGAIVRFFCVPGSDKMKCKYCGTSMKMHGWIDTNEGGHIVCPGDFVITGVKGEVYPCKPDIFALTYEAVDGPESNEARGPDIISGYDARAKP